MSPHHRRVTTALALSGTVSVLWLCPQLFAPGAEPSVTTVLVALAPVVLALAGLLVAHLCGAWRLVDTRSSHQVQAERQRKGAVR